MGLFSTKTKTKSQSDPWDEVIPYLLGNTDKPGVFPEAANQFLANKNDPFLNEVLGNFNQMISARMDKPEFGQVTDPGMFALNGNMDAAFAPVGSTQERGNVGKVNQPFNAKSYNVNPDSVDLVSARAGQGRLDPSQSLSKLLAGRSDNPWLQQQARSLTANLTRNMNENVMPGIRSEALASGQYGGSRQGIAEGLAMSRLNQDLAPAITGLFGGAHEAAQQRMFGTANSLNDQAFQNATGNVNRDFMGQQFNAGMNADIDKFNAGMNADMAKFNTGIDQFNAGLNQGTDQFNANLGLQNNNQLMQSKDQQLQNRMQGLNMLQQGTGMQDDQFLNLMDNALMPRQLDQDNLNNYANLMMGGAQLGNQTVSKSKSTPGIGSVALGTLAMGMGGLRGLGGMSGLRQLFK